MGFDESVDLVRETLYLMLLLSLPILGAALIIGLVVSLMQAVTQIQEQTLSFVPKILGMGLVAILAAPWIFNRILDFADRMFGSML